MLDPSLYKDFRPIHLGNNEILPGTSSKVSYSVGNLPSGTRVAIHMEVFRSNMPGPHVLIIGGIHGDEVNGVEIVRRLLEKNIFNNLLIGSVITVPLLNVHGFINFSRDVPDGKDVNRSFPGTLAGSLASRVARILTKNVLPQVDVIIDNHTGGQYRYNYPQVRITRGDVASHELAKAFKAPFIVQKAALRGSLRKVAKIANKLCLIYEAGEALRLDGFSIARGIAGIERTLHYLQMINEGPEEISEPVDIMHASWIRASHAGLFIWTKSSGSRVKKGEPLGSIGDPYGTRRVVVLSPREGYVIGHTNAPVVGQGDALFHIGF
ncbi:MAG TPA: succinylglutamate desuccinylase/aspartoacylase family protein [Saprospiraceae bacterium]|nr:succinylglutamate desuccinylase/aspartoacylase family protein [Saprospiraceae bacterium]